MSPFGGACDGCSGAREGPLACHGRARNGDPHGLVKRAGLDAEGLPRITPHQLRYTFGSLLIDVGEATSRVSRLMGHANEAITGAVYTHEIERRDNGERTRASMRAAFAPAPPETIHHRDRH